MIFHADTESDNESSNNSTQIELNSNHITVHQTTEESDNEERRTASLGDLSKMGAITAQNGSRSRTGTLERAQSLEITETPMSAKITPKKRKAQMTETDGTAEFKEPRLSADLSINMDSLQRGRLKSAYEWGKLEDAIYDTHNVITADDKPEAQDRDDDESLNTTMIRQVIAVADSYTASDGTDDEHKIKQMSMVNIDNNKSAMDEERISGSIVVVPEPIQIGGHTNSSRPSDRLNISWDSMERNSGIGIDLHSVANLSSSRNLDDTIKTFLEIEARNGAMEKVMATTAHIRSDSPQSSITIAPDNFQYKPEIGVYSKNNAQHQESLPMEVDSENEQIKIINYGTNMPDDVKVTRYPFGSLERPKSDVLKKLISQQLSDETLPMAAAKPTTNCVSTTTIISAESYTTDQPISLSIIGSSGNHSRIATDDTDLTESSSQLSPVYSSDGHGVNSINISSMDVSTRTAELVSPTARPDLNRSSQHENIVTISTDRSQPSSIIMIDDEKLDFTMRTLDEDTITTTDKRFSLTPTGKSTATNDEVIIIESLSSKKMSEPLVSSSIPNIVTPATTITKTDETPTTPNTFVTEICVQTPNSNETIDHSHRNVVSEVADELTDEELISNTTPPLTPTTKISSSSITTEHKASEHRQSMPDIGSHTSLISLSPSSPITTTPTFNEEEYIPRNSEIKFTTSIYESPNRIMDKRHSSHIDQIRSTFERNHNSEIPVPVRKTSTTSLRTSPSKIPVFNSASAKVSPPTTLVNNNNNNSHYGSTGNLAKTNGNINRVSVSVTSIKNSSRNPSGK